jgi:hypothetical protein
MELAAWASPGDDGLPAVRRLRRSCCCSGFRLERRFESMRCGAALKNCRKKS